MNEFRAALGALVLVALMLMTMRFMYKNQNSSDAWLKLDHVGGQLRGSLFGNYALVGGAHIEPSCALLFFGLSRGFKDVAMPSIQQFVIDANPGCDLYAHTYDSPYAEEVKFLSSRLHLVVDTEEEFEKARDLTSYQAQFSASEGSMDDMIKQWHSIDRVWNSMPNGGEQYSRIGIFRLDLIFEEPIDIDTGAGFAVLPILEPYSGMNDRFFFGENQFAKVWATDRFPVFAKYAASHKNQVNPDKFMKSLTKDLPITLKPLCFKQIKANGNIDTEKCPSSHPPAIEPPTTNSKCAILFFGLARKFKDISLPSIKEHIMNVNPGCDVYVHTYDIKTTSNSRNNEVNQPIYANEVKLISPRLTLVMDTTESFEKVRDLNYFRQFFPPDKHWGWVYPTSMDNMIKQWHSINAVWNAMPNEGKQYSRIGLFRLDMLYLEPMSVTRKNAPALVPGWASGRTGMNDRMFIGDYKYAKVWATHRFSLCANHAARHNNHVHSETFMKDLMTTAHVPISKTRLCFNRVRATGEVKNDCPKHYGGVVVIFCFFMTFWFVSSLIVRSHSKLSECGTKST